MTPENMPAPPAAGGATPPLRPPDFLLPQSERGSTRRPAAGPEVYVSWGGQIYGPAGVDDVLTGVRTAYFEEDALFWFEGRSEWRPVDELGDLFTEDAQVELPIAATRHAPPSEPIRPSWPATRSSEGTSGRRRRRRAKPASSSRSSRAGRLIVLGAVLLAVLVTAGLLLLVSLV